MYWAATVEEATAPVRVSVNPGRISTYGFLIIFENLAFAKKTK
jgi:hypothetical protein